MGYSWIAITKNFDRSLPISKIRFDISHKDEMGDIVSFWSESPNIDLDGKSALEAQTAALGWGTYHRFAYGYHGGVYNKSWSHTYSEGTDLQISSLPSVEGQANTYEYTPTNNLYWGGCRYDSAYDYYAEGDLMVYVEVSVFDPSKSTFKFSSTGGSESFSLSADTNWTATTTSDWVSLDNMSGTTGGSLTLTCDRNYTESARTATITFTNADSETFNITVNQKRGTTEKEVNKMYRNGGLIYQNQIFSTKLYVSLTSISFPKTGSTDNIFIKSNAPYTYSSNVDWLTITTAISGISVTAPNYTGSTDRTGTITITASNAGDVQTKTISVSQKVVDYKSYIHTATLENNSTSVINTGIYPTTATTFRVIGQGKGYYQGNKIVGFSTDESGSDDKDYRIFWYSSSQNLCFDFNNQRIQQYNWGGAYDGAIIDLTCSNYEVYDNQTSTTLLTGTAQTTMDTTTVPIYVDVGSWWVKRLQIWEGSTLVFDGEAAVDSGNVGLWDSVSNTLKYNPDLSMGYEE